jgi:hypothetical protein
MGEFDPQDRLLQACREASRYPAGGTLLKRNLPKKVLEGYADLLDEDGSIIFSSEGPKTQVRFLDLLPGDKGCLAPCSEMDMVADSLKPLLQQP